MSLCGLRSRNTTRIGLAATVVALILYQVDDLKMVEALHVAEPLHFIQGLFLGMGLAVMIGGQFVRRRGP